MTAYWAERALLPGGVARWVRFEVADASVPSSS